LLSLRFCFCMPPPPRCTLFPYTTLFRSSLSAFKKALELKCYAAEFDVHLTNDDVLVVHHDYDKEGYDIESTNYDYLAKYPLANGDRKSTRLNSSHVKISYAVFCLKKKIR